MGEILIDASFDGRTVRDYIRKSGISRAELIRLKTRESGILLNGVHVTVRAVLHSGDVLFIDREDGEEDENADIVPTDMNLDILHEDENILAINKPPYMPTHPSIHHFSDTLANGVAYIFRKRGIPFVFRACNRLDRDTSGVVIIAKSKGAAKIMSDAIMSGNVRKTYLCVVDGTIGEPITVKANIKRRTESIIERCVCPENEGHSAETEVVPLEVGNGMTFCRVQPKTGRTHQIRVHLAHIGTPIVGDTLYGKSSPFIGRQALHCCRMGFSFGGKSIEINAPLPDDMRVLLEQMKGK